MAQLQDLAARLAVPGLPEWTGVAALVALLLVALAYLLMPFSVFGVKGRLDALEAQLDEIRDEIRGLSIRFSDGPRRPAVEDWVDPPRMRNATEAEPRANPPIPPPASWPDPPRGGRPEPRLDWPTRR